MLAGEVKNLREFGDRVAEKYGERQRSAGTPGVVLGFARKLIGEQMNVALGEASRG